jgi:hypothetical protein
MEKQSRIVKFKKEFAEEINASKINVGELKNLKVSKEVLNAEVSLRKVFGDEIFERKVGSENIEGDKEILKLNDEDIAFDSEVQQICDDLVDMDFEMSVNVLLSKIAEKEEE